MRADTMADRTSLPLTGRLLVLDALAHGEASPPWEQAVLNIAGYTAGMLEAQGASVLVTTGTPAPASVAARARQFEQHGAEVVVFLRTGSHPSTQIRGVRALVPSPYALASRRLAERLLRRVSARTGLPSRGIPLWSWFPPDLAAMIRGLRPVSLVLECATPTCPADELLLMRRSFQLRLAHGLAEGILDYFGLPAAKEAIPLEPPAPLSDAGRPEEAVQPEERAGPEAADAGEGTETVEAGGEPVKGTAAGAGEPLAVEGEGEDRSEPGESPDAAAVVAADGAGPLPAAEAPVQPGNVAAVEVEGESDGEAPPAAVAFAGVPPVVVTARPPARSDAGPDDDPPAGRSVAPDAPAAGDPVLDVATFQPPAAEGLRSGRGGAGRPPAAAPGQLQASAAAQSGRAAASGPGGQPAPAPAPAQPERPRPAWAKKVLAVWPADPNRPVTRTVTPAWQQPSSPVLVPPYQGRLPPIGFVQTGQRPPWASASQPPPGPQHAPHTPWPAQNPPQPPHNAPAAGQEPGPAAQVPFLGTPGGPEPMIVWPDGSLVSPRAQILMRLQTRSAAEKKEKGADSPPDS